MSLSSTIALDDRRLPKPRHLHQAPDDMYALMIQTTWTHQKEILGWHTKKTRCVVVLDCQHNTSRVDVSNQRQCTEDSDLAVDTFVADLVRIYENYDMSETVPFRLIDARLRYNGISWLYLPWLNQTHLHCRDCAMVLDTKHECPSVVHAPTVQRHRLISSPF